MKKLFLFTVFVLFMFSHFLNASARQLADVSVTTKPAFDQIKPDTDPVKFIVHVYDEKGIPLKNARAEIALKSPNRGRFFSTDFPWVENSTLLELESTLSKGSFSFDYLIPIRGTYVLKTKVFLQKSAAPVEKIFAFKVHENHEEVKKLSLLTGILFAVGFFAGIFFQRSKRAFAALFFFAALIPSPLHAHKATHGRVKGSAQKNFSVKQAGRTLSVMLKPDHGIVGKLTCIQAALTDDKGNNINQPAHFAFKLANAEDNARVFESVIFAPAGKTMQCIQTADGANHILRVLAFDENPEEYKTNAKPVAAFKKEIEVESFAPPKIVVTKTLGFFLAIMAFGIFTGSLVEGLRKPQ